MDQKNLRKIIEIEDGIDEYISFDKQRLSQILVNLLSNAIKFTFEGFIKISVRKANISQSRRTSGIDNINEDSNLSAKPNRINNK
jgi:two-component system, sensor histidine kinase